MLVRVVDKSQWGMLVRYTGKGTLIEKNSTPSSYQFLPEG